MTGISKLLEKSLREQEFKRSQLSVTSSDYSDAVKRLVGHAQMDTSGSVAAAQLLLSLYNGYNWHVNLCDLGDLDYQNLQDALTVIRGRFLVHEEPHKMIENGREIFLELEKQWQHFHVDKRYSNNTEG